MKKLFALLLCLVLMGSCAAAPAEDAEKDAEKSSMGVLNVQDDFELKYALPEGYHMDLRDSNGSQIKAMLTPDDPARPTMELTFAFNELYSDLPRFNDLPEEDLKQIEDTFRQEDFVDITYMYTSYDTKLMVIREIEDDVDFVDIYTMYRGYEVEFLLIPGTGATTLTDEEIQLAVDFLSEVDFVPLNTDEPAPEA